MKQTVKYCFGTQHHQLMFKLWCHKRDFKTRHTLQAKRLCKFFCKSMLNVISHLEYANVDPKLVTIHESYLMGQGSISMASCNPCNSQFPHFLKHTICLVGIASLRDKFQYCSSQQYRSTCMSGIHKNQLQNGGFAYSNCFLELHTNNGCIRTLTFTSGLMA